MLKFDFKVLKANLKFYLTCLSVIILVSVTIISLSSSIIYAAENVWNIQRNTSTNDLDFYLTSNGATSTYFLDPKDTSFLNSLNVTNLSVTGTGNVGIGTATPQQKLDVRGILAVNGGALSAPGVTNSLKPGALDIGNVSQDYGGSATQWSSANGVAGLLMEAKDNTEIAVHDSGT